MAEVKMDLAELKAMEDNIKELNNTINDLKSKQKQVLFLHKHFKAEIRVKGGKGGEIQIQAIRSRYVSDRNPSYMITDKTMGMSGFYENFNIDTTLEQAVKNGYIEIIAIPDSNTSEEYVNMSEVVDRINVKQKEVVETELKLALNRATEAEHKLTIIDDKYRKQMLTFSDENRVKFDESLKIAKTQFDGIIKSLETDIETIKEEYDSFKLKQKELGKKSAIKYDELLLKYNDLKEDKVRLSLEQQISQLRVELEEERNKSIFKKLFK